MRRCTPRIRIAPYSTEASADTENAVIPDGTSGILNQPTCFHPHPHLQVALSFQAFWSLMCVFYVCRSQRLLIAVPSGRASDKKLRSSRYRVCRAEDCRKEKREG